MNLEGRIDDLLRGDENILNENANKDGKVIAAQRDLLAGAVSKEYASNRLLPKDIADAHKNGDIHFHDLDYTLAGYYNCMLIDFPGMLENGFTMGGAEIEQPKSIRTAAEVIPQIIVNSASNIYGGISAHRIDEFLEPYAEKSHKRNTSRVFHNYCEVSGKNEEDLTDKERATLEEQAERLTIKEIYDSAQSLEYEMNSAFSAGGQQPFVTFNFGLGEGRWAREIQKAILQVRIDGLGKEKRTAVFPKLVFTLKRGLNLNEGDPNYDIKQLALECSSKRIYPDLLSYDKVTEIYDFFVSPMGCRSFTPRFDDENGNPISYGRRNIGVATLNLPRIALESDTKEKFWELLDERVQLIYRALMYRYDSLAKVRARNAPILYQYGATGHRLDADSPVQQIFDNGEATASVGYTGLHEVAVKFFGKDWQDNSEAKQFTLDILNRMKEWANKWREKTGIAFTLYSTPAESLTHRFSQMDRKRFGEVEGITDKGYYVNSFHLDTTKRVDPFYKIDFEKDYPPIATGGNIVYVESHSLVNNLEALEAIWDYAYDRVPYFGVNSPVSKCFDCSYEGDFEVDQLGFHCPECDNRNPETLDCIERMCGYLSSVSQRKPITGRVKEIQSRVKHM